MANSSRTGSGLRSGLAVLAVAAATAIGTTGPSRAAGCAAVPTEFDYADYGSEIELAVEDIAALPSGALFLAGRFVDDGTTMHPALLVSEDGRDWSTVLLPYSGAGLRRLTTQGPSAIWGIVSLRQEGLDLPEQMVRSLDGGRTWCSVPLGDLDVLRSVETFRFFDQHHGLIVFTETPFGPGRTVYSTSDGGDSWLPLWPRGIEPDPEVETDFGYPGAVDPPAHTPVWRREMGLHRIDGLLRPRLDGDEYVIERYGYLDDPVWTEQSRISRHYRNVDGRLAP